VRLPTFSRQSDTSAETEERPAVATGSATAARPRNDSPTVTPPPATPPTIVERRHDKDTPAGSTADEKTIEQRPVVAESTVAGKAAAPRPVVADRTAEQQTVEQKTVVAGPKPRASLLATLGLITSVAAALLVLSGPLLGYGLGLAVLGLALSLGGISATGKRHIAGKTDALIGMVLALSAIVVGVLALTGSLSWLGTDTQPVTTLRDWLDTQVANRF
jgi:hypothetical protein